MSDLQNPLFDEEKEFLERKKLEYERALRGDVDHIKDQSVKVGKVALVGAGLAGGIWLISKAFGGKKRKRYSEEDDEDFDRDESRYRDDADDFEGDEFGAEAEYYTAGNGKRYRSVRNYRTAADSARVFMEQDRQEPGHDTDDLGFGSKAVPQPEVYGGPTDEAPYDGASAFNPEDFEDDPFKDLPYDDSRRLPVSHAFDDENGQVRSGSAPRAKNNMVASVLQSFLKSDTGKVLVAQVAAVALAMVTKKVSEFFPADKNPDLATSSGYVPTETGFAPATSLASPDSPDASTHTPSI